MGGLSQEAAGGGLCLVMNWRTIWLEDNRFTILTQLFLVLSFISLILNLSGKFS